MDVNDVRFFNTMLEYYLPRLDVSNLSDAAYSLKIAHLLKIRQMEAAGQVENVLSKLLTAK